MIDNSGRMDNGKIKKRRLQVMSNEKETVIQFGEGGFLRGFVDYFSRR